MPSNLDFRNVNSLWCSVLAETLHRCGVREAVVAPGSRSTALTIALARHPGLEAIPVLDERSAAFFALGLARQHHRPVVLVCTSGTAAANFFPAVIEARESGVPLLVITADRPPEMRECASGQTIDQQKLYGAYPRWQHECAVPEASLSLLSYLRQTVVHAFTRSLSPEAGPVHLNAPFRDPLPPLADGLAEKLENACDWERFFDQVSFSPPLENRTSLPSLPATGRGVIIAGAAQPQDAAAYAQAVGEIARKLGWPVLADSLSPLRMHAGLNNFLVTTYDTLLRNPLVAERLKPEAVLCLEGWPISKVLRAWIHDTDAPVWMVSESDQNRDALHGRTRSWRGSARHLADGLSGARMGRDYQALWAGYERKVRARLDECLQATTGLFEGRAVWLLAQHLPEKTPVFIANSMPVRDGEYFWPPNDRKLSPRFNRGANGIDGTLSTALGVAHGGRPAVLLTGDLALLHDTNGFLLRPKFRGSLTVVLINNRGGGIFQHLPVAQFDPPFEDYFATPQEADFGRLCAAYGVEHTKVGDWETLIALLATLPATGLRVLEVCTDRKRDAATRKQIFAEVAARLA